MNRKITIIVYFLLLSFVSSFLQTSATSLAQTTITPSVCNPSSENGESGQYSQNQLQTLVSQITVRIIGDHNGGSGTILAKKGNSYLVATNSHVILGAKSISIKTNDGKIYSAQIMPNSNLDKLDLAILQFQSNQSYCLPKEIATSNITKDIEVMAAGYSSTKDEFVFKPGKVQQIPNLSLKNGYEIGYTSDIEQGMSGRPIINVQGELVGINGKSAYPILNSGYVYRDGKSPSVTEIEEMRKLSWGIPITTLLAQIKEEVITTYSLPLPRIRPEISALSLTGWLGELEEKAKKITVKIETSGGNGSGVIINKQGDVYTVLTAAHVVCQAEATENCSASNYGIITPDGQKYDVEKNSIKAELGVDLAVVKFRSQKNYQVATLANYNLTNDKDRNYVFTAGYPQLGDKSPWRFTMGNILNQDFGLLLTNQSNLVSNSSERLQNVSYLNEGYELVYNNITYGGMSGGQY